MGTTFTVSRATEADEESIVELERLVWGTAEEATLKYFQWLTYMNPSGQAITHIAKNDSRQSREHILVSPPRGPDQSPPEGGVSL